MMRKLILFLIVACMMVTLFTGCKTTENDGDETSGVSTTAADDPDSDQPAEAEEVTLNYMLYTANADQKDTLEAMIDEFEKRNPNIEIIYEILGWGEYHDKLPVVMNSKIGGPDILEEGYERFVSYASRGALMDLTDVIANDKDFNSDAFKKLAYDAFNYNGKQYGVCMSYSAVVMFYNKDLFDANGLDYPDASWTWEDELEAAKKITDESKGIWGTYAPFQFWEFYKTIVQNGGSIWGADGKTVTINSKECVDAVQWMIDKGAVHKVSPMTNDDAFLSADHDLNEFAAGRLGMARFGIWNFGKFEQSATFNWDIALEPGNTQKGHHFFADGMFVSANTKNPEAAWEFIKFMSTDPFVIDLRIEKGWGLPAVASEEVMKAYYEKTPPESKKVVSDALDSLVLPPVGHLAARWDDMTGAVGDELSKASGGQIDVQTALDNAKAALEEIVKEVEAAE